jgi:undecaprenyl-diphosphatase
MQANLRTPWLDWAMVFTTRLADGGFLWIILAVLLAVNPRHRKLGVTILIAIAIEALACNILLKPLIARPRPFEINPAIQLLIPRPEDYSFPSGHAAVSFAAASVLFFRRSRGWRIAVFLAILISFSRLYLYVHYPSDVLVGAVIGIAAGWGAHRLAASLCRRKSCH